MTDATRRELAYCQWRKWHYMSDQIEHADSFDEVCQFCRERLALIERVLAEGVTGSTSDGYHTFDELYAYRKAFNALLFNQWAALGLYDVHKAWNHSDGEPCFGGGWFIVVAQTPQGQISNHYKTEDWDLFNVPVRQHSAEYDGHTPPIALERMLALAKAAPLPAGTTTEIVKNTHGEELPDEPVLVAGSHGQAFRKSGENPPLAIKSGTHGWQPIEPVHIRQGDEAGCLAACLAMVTGKSYLEVTQYLINIYGKVFAGERGGIHEGDVENYLADHGFTIAKKYRWFGANIQRQAWPAKAFAPVHILGVRGAGAHGVVLLADGHTVFDPYYADVRQLSDYPEVAYMIGVWALPEPPKEPQ